MREILFRGKRIDNGEWVEGYLVLVSGECIIIPVDADRCGGVEFDRGYWCDPATVGQFTGLTDKTGKQIFEDDIISLSCGIYRNKGAVKYFDDKLKYGIIDKNVEISFSFLISTFANQYSINNVGNIHDNPELLDE